MRIGMMKIRLLFIIVCILFGAFALANVGKLLDEGDALSLEEWRDTGQTGVSGVFRFSAYGDNGMSENPLRHTLEIVNNDDYRGMEDNDLRGFLDGRFKNGWNQPSQAHVRVGRRGISKVRLYYMFVLEKLIEIPWASHAVAWVEPPYPYLGEHELFRVLYRYDDIVLPPGARVVHARLELTVEDESLSALEFYLYSVNKDWNPGRGGVREDNVSPPKQGEVWWDEIAYNEKEWGLPGVGFASDDHPNADTPVQPLGCGKYRAGDKKFEISSVQLSAYIADRIRNKEPLLFLLKLADYLEDRANSGVAVYSANYGDSKNIEYRPRLFLEWESDKETQNLLKKVNLEYGRTYYLPRIHNEGSGDTFMGSFVSKPGFEPPTLEVRGGDDERSSPWKKVSLPWKEDWEWIEFRVFAGVHPVSLGEVFETRLRDTWVVGGPPERQEVEWTFVSPTEKEHRIMGEYLGHYVWEVHFRPDELGRWRYFWSHHLGRSPSRSPVGVFDVTLRNRADSKRQLKRLAEEIRESNLKTHYERMKAFEVRFCQLERAVLQLETPESFASDTGVEVRKSLDEVRSLIWGESVSGPIPLKAFPRKW